MVVDLIGQGGKAANLRGWLEERSVPVTGVSALG